MASRRWGDILAAVLNFSFGPAITNLVGAGLRSDAEPDPRARAALVSRSCDRGGRRHVDWTAPRRQLSPEVSMQKRLALLGLIAVIAGCGPDSMSPDPGHLERRVALAWGDGRENGTFLSHAYVTTQSYVNATKQTMLGKMKVYEAKNLYVNIGKFGTAGTIVDSYSLAASFLAQVAAYEQSSGYSFRVLFLPSITY